MLQGFNSLVLFVDDVMAVGRWYSNVLGLPLMFENDDYAYIDLGFGQMGFHPQDKKSDKEGTNQTVYWSVFSLEAALKGFIAQGAQQIRSVYQISETGCCTIVRDPFGHTIGLHASKL